jgi:hypothetical protein
MSSNELLRKFEKKFNQLFIIERCFLEARKVELFL